MYIELKTDEKKEEFIISTRVNCLVVPIALTLEEKEKDIDIDFAIVYEDIFDDDLQENYKHLKHFELDGNPHPSNLVELRGRFVDTVSRLCTDMATSDKVEIVNDIMEEIENFLLEESITESIMSRYRGEESAGGGMEGGEITDTIEARDKGEAAIQMLKGMGFEVLNSIEELTN